MENLYNILGCERTATEPELKQIVQKARLRLHPDKNPNKSSTDFISIEKAWYVLQCPQRRSIYDSLLTQNELMSNSSGFPIQDEISIDNFNKEEYDFGECNTIYWTSCRCGEPIYDYRMCVKDVEEFDVPSIPAPFKGFEEDKIVTRRRKALFLRQALVIVERFSYNPVTANMLAASLPWLERDQFDDIAVERNAYGNCGYALCQNPKGKFIQQQYRICSQTRRVYDMTKRKPFCSDWCFEASNHIRKQISKEPAWCHSKSELNSSHSFNLLDRHANGRPGKLVLDALNRLRFSPNNSSSDTESENDDIVNNSCIQLDALEINSNGDENEFESNTLGLTECGTESTICNTTATSQSFTCQDQALEEPICVLSSNKNQISTIIDRLREWLTEKALTMITSRFDGTNNYVRANTFQNPAYFAIMNQFYSKYDSVRSKKYTKTNQIDYEILNNAVIPLIDSVSPDVIRRLILWGNLKQDIKRILNILNVTDTSIQSKLELVVGEFNLTSKNVHLKHLESQLMSLTLLRLVAPTEPALVQLLDVRYLNELLKSIDGPHALLFINRIINPILRFFSLDSDDDVMS